MEVPAWIGRVYGFIERNRIWGWIGFVVTVVTGLASVATDRVALGVGLVALGAAIGLLVRYVTQWSEASIICLHIKDKHCLKGPRGTNTKSENYFLLEFRKRDQDFLLCNTQVDGRVTEDEVQFRNLGPRGDNRDRANWRTLDEKSAFLRRQPGGTLGLWIHAPAAIQPGDYVEVRRFYSSVESFNEDEEAVGKFIIYPTKCVELEVIFEGCVPEAAYAARVIGPRARDNTHTTLEPTVLGTTYVLSHKSIDPEPSEVCVVSWSWRKT